MPGKQNVKAIDQWNREHTNLIRVRPRKEERLPERVQLAVDRGYAKSKQAYILNALKKVLAEDGIPELRDERTPDDAP